MYGNLIFQLNCCPESTLSNCSKAIMAKIFVEITAVHHPDETLSMKGADGFEIDRILDLGRHHH